MTMPAPVQQAVPRARRWDRRAVLQAGAAAGVFPFSDLLRLRAAAPGGSKRPARSLILVMLGGGPSQLDTYDLKPGAPEGVRGEYRPIRTRVPGIDVCEHFPRQAALMDRLALIRSVVGAEGEHNLQQVMSGWGPIQDPRYERPPVGSVLSRLGRPARGIPPFVSLVRMGPSLKPGHLGASHRAFVPVGQEDEALSVPDPEAARRLAAREALLGKLDRRGASSDEAAGFGTLQKRAFEVLTSGAVRKALDLGREPQRVRERYGKAEQLLMGLRLAEAGVACVAVNLASTDRPYDTATMWDTHRDNFDVLDQLLPHTDQGIAALVDDLYQRGLDREVVVLIWGEMGRTPKINKDAGRDHWQRVMSCVLAGGGLKTGRVVGATDAWAAEAKDRPCTMQSVLATVYHVLGIDPAAALVDRAGRPVYLLEDHEPIRELI
jgi:hypothetical protein